MSATPVVTPADLPGARSGAVAAQPRVWMRALSFSALALYGVQRWGRLMHDPPGWRLVGLAALAIALAVGLPLARHLTARWPARTGTVACGLIAAALLLAAFPVAGLRWHWVWHLQIAISVRTIGNGLGNLADVLVPYLGHVYSTQLVIMLGAAVLLLDAASALAFAPREIGDGRRAAVALPLIALAVVPATLVRPAAPVLQGLVLFALLALFMWGERIARGGLTAAAGVACAAGIAGAIVAPLVDEHHPWVNYRAWAGAVTGSSIDSFNWNQTYGPLRWPQDGHVVFTVKAAHSDYWKAQDLNEFDGSGWVTGPPSGGRDPLPTPRRAAVDRWSEPVEVTLEGMRTADVIGGSGFTGRPAGIGAERPGTAPGTWVAYRPLKPGRAYTVKTYSPRPSTAALEHDSGHYPWAALTPDLTLTIPEDGGGMTELPFAPFHFHGPSLVGQTLARSPYAPAYALAQRLAARSASPADFVVRVQRYLDSGTYVYDQQTKPSRYPLLDFLFHSKSGYCQQFSGTMAMLLRMGGVPARVASGFTSGFHSPRTHTWSVSDIDAHAWVEAWFPHVGWVRFDPTPRVAPARGGATSAPQEFDHRAAANAVAGHSGQTLGESSATSTSAAGAATGGGHHHHRRGRPAGAQPWPWIGGGAGLLVALLALGWALSARLGARADPLVELERALARTGRPLQDGVTLVALEHRFRGAPAAAAYIRALRLQRYGGTGEEPTASGRRALRAELSSGLGFAGRLRGWWALPPRPPRRPPHPPAPASRQA